jgi:hypothetical protein
MRKLPFSTLAKAACLACAATLAACTPKYDWREVRSGDAHYVVVLPAKPATHSRPIDLDGLHTTMTMTATEVDGATFAVGTAELPDAEQALKALAAMKTAMVRNIGGTVRQEKPLPPAPAQTAVELEATGMPGPNGKPRLLLARFIARDKRVYQLVILGHEDNIPRDAAETFFTSFKAQ